MEDYFLMKYKRVIIIYFVSLWTLMLVRFFFGDKIKNGLFEANLIEYKGIYSIVTFYVIWNAIVVFLLAYLIKSKNKLKIIYLMSIFNFIIFGIHLYLLFV
jgi:hypothetical protein